MGLIRKAVRLAPGVKFAERRLASLAQKAKPYEVMALRGVRFLIDRRIMELTQGEPDPAVPKPRKTQEIEIE